MGSRAHATCRTSNSGFADGAERTELESEGLIHHSDSGVQYACRDYTNLLEQGEIQISMSRVAIHDNARAEGFMRTLKEEEVHETDYRDRRRRRSIGESWSSVQPTKAAFRATILTPEEFEQASRPKMVRR